MIQRATWRPRQPERYSGSYSWRKRNRFSNTCLLRTHPFPAGFAAPRRGPPRRREAPRRGDSWGRRRRPGCRGGPAAARPFARWCPGRGEALRGRAAAGGALGGIMICFWSTTQLLAAVFLLPRFSAWQRLASPRCARRHAGSPAPGPSSADAATPARRRGSRFLLPHPRVPVPGPRPRPRQAACSPGGGRRQAEVLIVLMKMANTHPFHLAAQKQRLLGMQYLSGLAMKLISPNYWNLTNEMSTHRPS